LEKELMLKLPDIYKIYSYPIIVKPTLPGCNLAKRKYIYIENYICYNNNRNSCKGGV